MNTLTYGNFSLSHKEYIQGGPIWSGLTWSFTNSNPESPLRKITVWKPRDYSYMVSVYLPFTMSKEEIIKTLLPTTGNLPARVNIMEAVPERSDNKPLSQLEREWVVKAYDTKECYTFLQYILHSLPEKDSEDVTQLHKAMATRYHISD